MSPFLLTNSNPLLPTSKNDFLPNFVKIGTLVLESRSKKCANSTNRWTQDKKSDQKSSLELSAQSSYK